MKQYKLTKIHSTHDNLRTNEMVGTLPYGIPEVGLCIYMEGEGLDFGVRYIQTTYVVKIVGNEYHTKNSVYTLEEV